MYEKTTDSISTNLTLQDNTVKSTKGFLYEIRTQEGQLVGYLFGTQHAHISIDSLERLDPRILTRFDNSSHVFFELDNLFHNDDINEPPTGVEHFLYRRGIAQKKEFRGLETELSRKKKQENHRIDDQKSHLDIKATGVVVISFMEVLKRYDQIVKLSSIFKNLDDLNTNLDDLTTIVNDFFKCLELMTYIVKNMEFFDKRLDNKFLFIIDELSKLFIIDKFRKLLAEFGIIPDQFYTLKEYFLSTRDMNHPFEVFAQAKKLGAELTKNYEEGDKTVAHKAEDFYKNSMTHKYKKELDIKELQERDAVMAQTLHNDLLETVANIENRCGFYAPGAIHVIGDYPNSLPKLLVQKGWILNEVDMSQDYVPSLCEYSTLNPEYISTIDQHPNTSTISAKTNLPFIAKERPGYYVDATLDITDKNDSEKNLIETKLSSLKIPFNYRFFQNKQYVILPNVNVKEDVEQYAANLK